MKHTCDPVRLEACVRFITDLLDVEEDLFEPCTELGAEAQCDSINSAARSAGFSEAEIAEAWAVIGS